MVPGDSCCLLGSCGESLIGCVKLLLPQRANLDFLSRLVWN